MEGVFIPWLPCHCNVMKQPALYIQIYYILWHIYTVLQCTDMQHQRMLPSCPVGWVDNDDDHGIDCMGMMNGDAGSNGTETED